MTASQYVLLFLTSVIFALGGCTLFANGIEWLGKRLKVSEGAIGSIFAAVGTALPETTIPVIAIFFGTRQEQTDVGLGAILGAPFMLSTLVLPILAGLLVLYAKMGKRKSAFVLNYQEVHIDLSFFLIAYGLALACVFVSIPTIRYGVAALLILLYLVYMKLKFSSEPQDSPVLAPLILARRSTVPSYAMIGRQVAIGLIGLVGGAYLFITVVKSLSAELAVSPLLLSVLITPMATELPEMLNSFLWLYRQKDTLAVGNVTGAMVFQGTFPVSVGLIGTSWNLTPSALAAMGLAIVAVAFNFSQLRGGGHWRPWLLGANALLYIGFFTLYASVTCLKSAVLYCPP